VVAADGSGDFTTIQAAIDAAPQLDGSPRWVITVKPGYYHAPVYAQREKRFIVLRGTDPLRTTIGFDLTAGTTGLDGRPIGTFKTATLAVDADDFTVENLTIVNSAGPNGQALAIRVDGDRFVTRNCRYLGWQDTVLVNRGRHYFEDCYIAGHVDFIFGGATAFFSRCELHAWRAGYLTAASTPRESVFGLVFVGCHITAESSGVRTFLGRPWRDYASVMFIDTLMDDVVRPEGWDNWGRREREGTARFAEAGSRGDGARGSRVVWARQVDPADAQAVSPGAVLGGADGWKPEVRDRPPPAEQAAIGRNDIYAVPGFTREGVLRLARAAFPSAHVEPVAEAPSAKVVSKQNLVYAKVGLRELQLDVYRPAGKERSPAVLIIHGGGWVAGDRTMERPLAVQLAERGYVAVPVAYRLGIDGRFPAAVHDLKAAIRWLRAHAGEYGIDPARVAAVGGSAGGTMAALLGASNGMAALEGDEGCPDWSSEVQAVVCLDGAATFADNRLISGSEKNNGRFYVFMHGPYRDNPAIWHAMSPLTYVSARSAPTYFLNSTSALPILPGREEMVERLKSLGIRAKMEVLPDTPHPFWLVHPWFEIAVDRIDAFLSGMRDGKP